MKRITLICLTALFSTVLSAQTVSIRRGDCTPSLIDDGVAGARLAQQPRRLPSPSTQWDSTRIYRQAVVLVSFSDTDFKMENPRETYDSMLNVPGYNKRKGPGCMAEYLREQSGGLFNVHFDVYGPVKVSSKAQPYSKPNGDTRNYGRDVFIEATEYLIDTLGVDFTPYDWYNNGNVTQVIYVYAGVTGNQDTEICYGHIWPNTGTFSTIATNGKRISNYTSSAELWYNGSSCGIGTILHEYTHSLGLPDIYPTTSSAGFSVMDEWDLMDGGNFTNYGWCPCSYTPLEKWLLGWTEFTELEDAASIRGMKPVADGGPVYRIKHSNNEWLLLENRQQRGWDAGNPGHGLLIYHVSYSSSVWSANVVNNDQSRHRFELFHADNMDYDAWDNYIDSRKLSTWAHSGLMNNRHLSTSPYPWCADSTTFANDSLTNLSVPAAKMLNTNAEGSRLLGKPITNIRENADGTIDFDFLGGTEKKAIKGDVNGDGTVDVADISAVITIMAGAPSNLPQPGEASAADVNGDGSVDVADISAIITIMAGGLQDTDDKE